MPLQAAAEGLGEKFRVGKEEKKAGNRAREDFRGYVRDPFTGLDEFALPQEVKKEYKCSSTQDADGVHSNFMGFGKVCLHLFQPTAASQIQGLICTVLFTSDPHAPLRQIFHPVILLPQLLYDLAI